ESTEWAPSNDARAHASSATTAPCNESGLGAICGALPIVEKEEHRGALGDRAQEIAELAQCVRTNHVAVVLREVVARLTLAREHAEVILPEIHHHFTELAFAGHGARQLRGLNLSNELLCLARRSRGLGILQGERSARIPFVCGISARGA